MSIVEFESLDASLIGRTVQIEFPAGATSNNGQSKLAGVVASVSEFGSAIIIKLVDSNDPVLVRPKMKKMLSKELVEPRGNPSIYLVD
jgi:hypothetical protein